MTLTPNRAEPSAKPANILLVDDNPLHLKLNCRRLRDEGFVVETVASADEAFRMAMQGRYDAIVSDVVMNDVDGFALCRRLREEPRLASTPVILLSAHFDEEADQQLAARVGAFALVRRTPSFDAELDVIRRSLHAVAPTSTQSSDAALHEQHLSRSAHHLSRLAQEVEISKERYRTLLDNASDAVSVLSTDGVILEANRRCGEMFGVSAEQMVGRHVSEFAPPGKEEAHTNTYNQQVGKGVARIALPLVRADGSTIFVESGTTVIDVAGQQLVLAISRDVTESVLATQALAAAEERYRTLVERMPDVLWTLNSDGEMTFVSRNVSRLLGYTPEEIYAGTAEFWRTRLHPDDVDEARRAHAALVGSDTLFDREARWRHKDGHYVWVWSRVIGVSYRDGVKQYEGMFTDISEKKRLEEQLRFSQKMDAIGQLTGGIAHDFNNILAVILANCDFLMDGIGPHDQRRAEVEDVRHAADRAVALTRQLLAFSRRQVLEPTLMNVNGAVTGIEKMLRRLIGEDIEFSVLPTAEPTLVRADVGQIEQVIMNLVVNARDAMPGGGKLSIETANVELDDSSVTSGTPMLPGKYVMLAISDTGTGMSAETQRRIFEPFFTTKELGKGTGLGLATCYGIVKQSGGYIWAYSELGQGTVFKVYLPFAEGQVESVRGREPTRSQDLNGSETVLLIEDDELVRAAVRRILTAYGYRVLVACNGHEAYVIAKLHPEPIDLILSDIVMPGDSGPKTVERLSALCGEPRSLFMSGYTDHAALRDGVIETSMNFIQKPFTSESMAKKLRAVLDA